MMGNHTWSMQIIVNHGFRDKSINAADLGWRKRMRVNRRAATWGSWALEEDLFGGDHGEARAVVGPLDGVAELGPRAALHGAPGEAGVREAAGAGGGGVRVGDQNTSKNKKIERNWAIHQD